MLCWSRSFDKHITRQIHSNKANSLGRSATVQGLTMTNRPSIPLPNERAVLIKSRRRCCLCFWLEGIDKVQRGQIAHLDHDKTNMNEDNLCFLCNNEHHDDYDSGRRQSKGLKKGEVKHYRNELYKEMELRFYALEVERKLRFAKQEIRKTAHAGLTLRAQEETVFRGSAKMA